MTVSYFVNYRKQGDTTWSRWPSDGSTLNTLSTVVGQNPPGPALAPSQAYEFEVIATNAFGNSTSTISSGTTTSGVAFQSIALNPANPTFTAGFTGTIASVVVTMTSGSFSGNLSVTTGSSNFTIVNGQLQVTNANLTAGPQSFTIQATQSNATNTPYTQGFTVQVGSALAESPEAKVVKVTGQTIIASRTNRVASNGPFNYFQLTSGAQIQLSTDGTNYSVQPATNSVTAILYHKDTLFQVNSAGDWYYWNTSTSDATAGTAGYVFYNLAGPVGLSNTSYTANAAPGTYTATISCPMSSNAANDTFPGTWGGTFTLDSASTSTFQITGSTITNKVTLSAASYNPTITAALNVTGSDSTVYSVGRSISSGIAINAPGTLSAPAQAANAGFTHLSFNDDFTTQSIATSGGATSGFKWYWTFAIGTFMSSSSWTINTTQHAADVPIVTSAGNNASPSGGILNLTGARQAGFTGGAGNQYLQSFPGNVVSTVPAIGNGVWQHCYFEAYIAENPRALGTFHSSSEAFPAFWSWGAEAMAGFGSINSPLNQTGTEIDFLEDTSGVNFGSGTPDPIGLNVAHVVNPNGNGVYGANTTYPTQDAEWHTFGCLWTNNNVKFYKDNVQYGPAGGVDTTGLPLETFHQFMVLGTGIGWPMYFDWVRVWTA